MLYSQIFGMNITRLIFRTAVTLTLLPSSNKTACWNHFRVWSLSSRRVVRILQWWKFIMFMMNGVWVCESVCVSLCVWVCVFVSVCVCFCVCLFLCVCSQVRDFLGFLEGVCSVFLWCLFVHTRYLFVELLRNDFDPKLKRGLCVFGF